MWRQQECGGIRSAEILQKGRENEKTEKMNEKWAGTNEVRVHEAAATWMWLGRFQLFSQQHAARSSGWEHMHGWGVHVWTEQGTVYGCSHRRETHVIKGGQ